MFKVKEVIKVPPLMKIPNSHPNIVGVASLRGETVPVIDLRSAIGFPPSRMENPEQNLIITEYNRTVQGFLVGAVRNIVNMAWSDILPPPASAGRSSYLTAITQLKEREQNHIVEIIDVEKVLAEIIDYDVSISEEVLDRHLLPELQGRNVLIADDSSTARNQIRATLSQLGMNVIECRDGLEAFQLLKRWSNEGRSVSDELLMLITDAEMPGMDGYRLTYEVRNDPKLKDLFITLNTSLSGSFNEAMVKKVGCDRFISKFQPDLLVATAQDRIRELAAMNKTA